MNQKPLAQIITGIIQIHRRGFGFVAPVNKRDFPTDIFIPKDHVHGAVQGDTVEVEVLPTHGPKGPDGRVVRIVKRARQDVVGTVVSVQKKRASVHVPLLGRTAVISARSGSYTLSRGSRVLMRVKKWTEDIESISADVIELLGSITDPKSDIPVAIAEYQIATEFPSAVEEETSQLPKRITSTEISERRDLRSMTSVTIDPESAKDFDDALFVRKEANGDFHLAVHIADVSHYVPRGSATDEEAKRRSNSTYFPGTCVPMLPKALSEELCSLKPEVNRLAVSVLMHLDPAGAVLSHEIVRSVIRSHHRFTYEEAKEVLDGNRKSQFAPMLQEMVELCRLLKGHRRERGSIEFSLPELAVFVNPDGEPTHTRLIEYDITHQMVEEFMLKANELVAKHLTDKDLGLAYRIHETPSGENLGHFVQMAQGLGFQLPADPSPEDLQELFIKARSTPYGDFLAVAYIRSLKLAIYSPDNIGHYGLSLEHYCHFTSPIRRYADLIVHRVLFEDGYDEEELEALTRTCSEQERRSAKAEESVLRLKKLRLLSEWHKEKRGRIYEAIVTRVMPAGLVFEALEIMLEGFLHVSQIDGDYYIFNEVDQKLEGETLGRTFRCGGKIRLSISDIDLIFGEVNWRLCPEKKSK